MGGEYAEKLDLSAFVTGEFRETTLTDNGFHLFFPNKKMSYSDSISNSIGTWLFRHQFRRFIMHATDQGI